MEIEAGWSKGTIRTAALLCSCEKEEEFAAVWICAFVLSLTRGRSGGDETHRNAFNLEYEAAPVFAKIWLLAFKFKRIFPGILYSYGIVLGR